jgi:DNA-binding NarL/FixJ family response regulator
MPFANGITVARKVKQMLPQTKIMVLSAYDDDEHVFALMKAGGSVFLLKQVDKNELIDSVRREFSGETVLAPEIAAKIARLWANSTRNQGKEKELTPRETEILGLAAEGLAWHSLHTT